MFKKIKKTSNGVRHQVNFKKFLLAKSRIFKKKLCLGKKKNSGRSSLFGAITVRHKGSGNKKLYRSLNNAVDLKSGLLLYVNYDSCRNSFISVYYDFFYKKFYNNLFTNNTTPGSLLFSYKCFPELYLGSTLSLKFVPTGSTVHSICNNFSFKYIKSSGSYGTLIEKGFENCKVRLPSGIVKQFSVNTLCVLGSVYNNFTNSLVVGKAGRSRLKNKRPSVRGVAMNPVDHPHGGRTNGGMPSVTPWGIPTKGKPTTKKKHVKI